MNRQIPEHFQDSKTTLYVTIMVDTCHHTFVKCTTLRTNPNVNYGLRCVSVSSSVVANGALWCWMSIVREVMSV